MTIAPEEGGAIHVKYLLTVIETYRHHGVWHLICPRDIQPISINLKETNVIKPVISTTILL